MTSGWCFFSWFFSFFSSSLTALATWKRSTVMSALGKSSSQTLEYGFYISMATFSIWERSCCVSCSNRVRNLSWVRFSRTSTTSAVSRLVRIKTKSCLPLRRETSSMPRRFRFAKGLTGIRALASARNMLSIWSYVKPSSRWTAVMLFSLTWWNIRSW